MTTEPEVCFECLHFIPLQDGVGYCDYTYNTQLFMTRDIIESMKKSIIPVNNIPCDQYEESENDIPLSANTDPYDQAS